MTQARIRGLDDCDAGTEPACPLESPGRATVHLLRYDPRQDCVRQQHDDVSHHHGDALSGEDARVSGQRQGDQREVQHDRPQHNDERRPPKGMQA